MHESSANRALSLGVSAGILPMAQDCAGGTLLHARQKQRELFDVARLGDVRSFKSLLRKSSTTAKEINFQYSAVVTGRGGSNLWPWYWCIDSRDAMMLCWAAPAGIEPEAGDTLLMITLKLGMEEHAKSVLETPTLSLGIRNSSGRDAARIAASCGRESLMISKLQVQALGEAQRQGPTKARTIARRRRRGERRARLGTSRAKRAKLFPANSVAPFVPPSCAGGYPGVEPTSPRDNTKAGVLDDDEGESPGFQRIGVRKGRFETASTVALGAAVIAGTLLRQQQQQQQVGDEGTNIWTAHHQGGGERKSSVSGGETSPNFAEFGELHPRLGETRAVAVQTDPERVCARDDPAPTAPPGRAQQTTGYQTPALLSPVPLKGTMDDAPLQRRSTAPGDILSHARGPQRSTYSSTTGPGGFGGGEPSDRWQNICGTVSDALKPPQREGISVGEGIRVGRRVSGTVDESLAGSITSVACSAEPHLQNDSEKSSPATTGKQGLLCNGDETEHSATPGMEHIDLQPQHTLGPRVGGASGFENDDSSPGAVDPFERRVDEVTRQMQEILREDALQDDGTLDYSAAFELFDVDHDGNATRDELRSVFVRLGMRNLLDDQGITMVVERVPRNTSGLITQDELQQFADRPAGLPWAPHRGSSDHVQGYEDVRDVKFGLGFSVLLHELQANAVPRARGEFPWKKSPKDRSSVSLFVRITRGPHVVESTPVVSSWSPLDGDISDAKRSAAGWSWQWKETLRVPGLFQNETRRTERAAGDEEDEREERSAGPLVVAANNNEGCPPKIQQSSEAVSTSVVVSGGDADDVNLRGDSDPSSSCEVGTTVDPHRGDSTDSSGSRRVSESTVEDQQTSEGPAVAEAAFPKADGSAKKQRGPFFWSPRRGRRNTKAAAGKKQSSGFPASHHGNGGAVRTTPDVALITAGNDRSVNNNNSGSSSDADTSELDKQRQPGATRSLRRRSARRSTSSGQICPEVLVKANDTVISGLGFATGRVNADANDGETRKKTVRFWGPGRRRGRRNHAESGDPAIDEHDSQQSVLSRCDSEASTVFDISDPGENGDGRAAANTGKIEGPAVPDDEPSIVSVPQDSPRKKARSSSFWSPRRKGNKDAKKTEEDSDAHGGDESGGTATTGPRILGETTNRASHSWGKSAGRRRRAPPKASATTSEDVMLLEVWEVKGAAVTSPCAKKNEESSVSAPECGDGQTMAGSPRARDSEEPDSYNRPHLGGTEDASPRPGSGKEPLPEQTPEHAQPLGATVETGTGPTPATENNLDHPAIGSKAADIDVLVATGEGGVEDDRERAIGDDVSAAANGPPVAAGGATSTKTSRRKLTFLFTSPLKKVGRAKGEMPSAIPHPRSPVTSSETETPLASLSLDPGKVITSTEGGQQEEATPDEQGVRETSEAALHPETSNVPEERSNDDEDDNEADGSYTPSQAQRSRIAASFFSAYKGINTATTKESPRSAAKPKPVLWGRMTIRVADVLGRSVSHGHHLVGRQNVPTRDGSDAAERVSSSNRVPFQSPAQRSRGGSSPPKFGVSMPRRGPKTRTREPVETLGTFSAGDELDETATGLSPHATGSWFEIEHPKGKPGKRAKGRLRLTATCSEPHHAFSDNNSVA